MVSEISMTLRPNGIENFKDLMAQWYRKFQRPYGPIAFGHKVFEISDTFGP